MDKNNKNKLTKKCVCGGGGDLSLCGIKYFPLSRGLEELLRLHRARCVVGNINLNANKVSTESERNRSQGKLLTKTTAFTAFQTEDM